MHVNYYTTKVKSILQRHNQIKYSIFPNMLYKMLRLDPKVLKKREFVL